MTHGAPHYYRWSTQPDSTFSYTYSLTRFLLPWLHAPDPKLADTFFYVQCVFEQGGMWKKNWVMCVWMCVIVNMSISLSKYGNTGRLFAKCLSVQPIIPKTPLLGAKPSVHIRWGLEREIGGITFIGKVSWQIDFLT